MRRERAAQLIAIRRTFCSKLQVEKPAIPSRDLNTLEAEARRPPANIIQTSYRAPDPQRIARERCQGLLCFHCSAQSPREIYLCGAFGCDAPRRRDYARTCRGRRINRIQSLAIIWIFCGEV